MRGWRRLTTEQWERKVAEIENRINKEITDSIFTFRKSYRSDKRIVLLYEHIDKKYIIRLNFLNPSNQITPSYKNKPVIISILEIPEARTLISSPEVISEIALSIEQENEIIKKIRTHMKELTLKGMF